MGAKTADRRPKVIQGDHSKRTFERFNHDENRFLNCIVTGDEMWVHYAETVKEVETSGSPPLKKFAVSVCWQGFARSILRFTWNNTDSFHAKRSN